MSEDAMSTDDRWVGSMPELYDRYLGPALFEPFAHRLAALTSAAASANSEQSSDLSAVPRRLLELAAGTGIATAELVKALPDLEIIATDLNPSMVALAQPRVPGATWRQADAQDLDFVDGFFDLVVCQFGVMFFPNKQAAFAEAARVLSPGGTMMFTVWDVVEYSDFAAAMVESLAAVLPVDTPSFLVRVPYGYADAEQITSDLEAGGLRLRGLERVVLRGTCPSARDLARGFAMGTPLRFELAERGSLEQLTQALSDDIVARLGSGPIEGDLTAFVVTAVT
ncbi:class I SAM-dependent methyltransferase [Jatrophihabitans sp. DSM 45814]